MSTKPTSATPPVQPMVNYRYVAHVGDYVLATKYGDGDPCDHFFVGFVSGYTHHGRYLCADNDGNNQRANGFRRVEKLTADEGRRLVEMMPVIGDKRGPSVWWHLSQIRGIGEDQFCESCKYEKDGHCRCERARARLEIIDGKIFVLIGTPRNR